MTLWQDLRYALRMMRRAPDVTAIAVISLALGMGANTTIFTLINAVMLKQLPVQEPSRLVMIGDPAGVNSLSHGSPRANLFSYPQFEQFRLHHAPLTEIFAAGNARRVEFALADRANSAARRVQGRLVSGNYFQLLGVPAIRGRVLTPEDDRVPGGSPVMVISYGFWQRQFGMDPSIIGKTAKLNNSPFTIIGIAPPEFFGDVVGAAQDFWAPLTMQEQIMPGRKWLNDINMGWLLIMGRLSPGATVDQARASLNVIYQQMMTGPLSAKISALDRAEIPKQRVPVGPGGPGFSRLRRQFSEPLLILMALVGLVLLVACGNVANLLLARATARQKEVSVRLALGAGRWRLTRQLLTESLVLACAGGLLGFLIAQEGGPLLLRLVAYSRDGIPLDLKPDIRLLGFTAGVSLITGLLFGLVPALRSARADVAPSLKENSRGLTRGGSHWSLGKLLVAGQVALSLVLLVGAGLFVRSLRNLQQTELGYARDRLVLLNIDPIPHGYKGPQIVNLYRQLRDRIQAIPGVSAVTMSENGLFSGTESSTSIRVEGYTAKSDRDETAAYDTVGPNYFASVGIPLLAGRDITERDTDGSPKVAVINEKMAKFYFGQANPLGKHVTVLDDSAQVVLEIVGVSRDAVDHQLRGDVNRRFYVSYFQNPGYSSGPINFEIRTAGDPSGIMAAVRKAVQSVDSSLPTGDMTALTTLVDKSILQERLIAKLATGFGLLALVLACIGLYGVMSYTVAQRTNELGIRVALGAGRGQIVRMILRETSLILGIGSAIGLSLALAGGRMLKSILYGLSTVDPLTLVGATVLLSLITLLAGYLPARRAALVDPMLALRYE